MQKKGRVLSGSNFVFSRSSQQTVPYISRAGTVSFGDPNRGGGVLDTDFHSLRSFLLEQHWDSVSEEEGVNDDGKGNSQCYNVPADRWIITKSKTQ